MLTHGVTHWDPDTCTGCRYKTLQLRPTPAFQPHFNMAVGEHVNTDREFRDALKRCSERNSISTGIDHDYQPRYPGDTKPELGDETTQRERLIHDAAVAALVKDPARV